MSEAIVKITNNEYIKTLGGEKFDGVWITRLDFQAPATSETKEKLVITVCPFAYLDDGSKAFYPDDSKKVYLDDVQAHIDKEVAGQTGGIEVLQAFLACLNGAKALINQQNIGWDCTYNPPA